VPDCFSCTGTVFRITPTGSFTKLHSFCQQGGQECLDGSWPQSGVVEGPNATLYGTTESGGTGYPYNPDGTLYSISAATGFVQLDSFEGGYGANPQATPVLAADGNFYSTTPTGGEYAYFGSLYQLTPSGGLASIYGFSDGKQPGDYGNLPYYGVIQASDGNFYGTTIAGGTRGGLGTVFRAEPSPPIPPPVQLSLSANAINSGDSVTLTWQVMNAYSMTLQQCYAYIENNATTAGSWTGLQSGTMSNGVYSGSTTITPTATGFYTYALTCGGVESGFASLSVNGARARSTTSLTTNSPVTLGTQANIAIVVSSPQSMPLPTGIVTLKYGNTTLGTATLAYGAANFSDTLQLLPSGNYEIHATYSGDANFLPSASQAVVSVLGYVTWPVLSATPGVITEGQSATIDFSIQRGGNSGFPSGTVTFSWGKNLATVPLVNGAATFIANSDTVPWPLYPWIVATYNGDAFDQPSHTALWLTILEPTKTALKISPNPVAQNGTTTLTAWVIAQPYVPINNDLNVNGTVTFTVGSQTLGQAALSEESGVAHASITLSPTDFSPGTYTATATYSGNGDNAASSGSAQLTIQ
jgi:uncharacterized repeat protein (TIGR03803 family)